MPPADLQSHHFFHFPIPIPTLQHLSKGIWCILDRQTHSVMNITCSMYCIACPMRVNQLFQKTWPSKLTFSHFWIDLICNCKHGKESIRMTNHHGNTFVWATRDDKGRLHQDVRLSQTAKTQCTFSDYTNPCVKLSSSTLLHTVAACSHKPTHPAGPAGPSHPHVTLTATCIT